MSVVYVLRIVDEDNGLVSTVSVDRWSYDTLTKMLEAHDLNWMVLGHTTDGYVA